eukprot:5914170-Pyramimonas_sp.AAC.1
MAKRYWQVACPNRVRIVIGLVPVLPSSSQLHGVESIFRRGYSRAPASRSRCSVLHQPGNGMHICYVSLVLRSALRLDPWILDARLRRDNAGGADLTVVPAASGPAIAAAMPRLQPP